MCSGVREEKRERQREMSREEESLVWKRILVGY
jgi:hypothetical protein